MNRLNNINRANRLPGPGGKPFSWSSWFSLATAVVEDAQPARIVLTCISAKSLTKDDFSITGKTISSGTWAGNTLTLILSADVDPEEAITLTLSKGGGLTKAVTNNVSWLTYWTTQYKNRVVAAGGSVTDEAKLRSELAYVKQHNLQDKIAYWISKDFGFKAGTEGNPTPCVAFSFDDGWASAYNTWQYFAGKGSGRGTFFINSKFIGTAGYLTWEQVHEMRADGCDFQCHTWSHGMKDVYGTENLIPLTDAEVENEFIQQDLTFVANGLNKPIHMAYPQYVTDFDRILPIVAKYRKSMRGGGSNYVSPMYYYTTSWWSYYGKDVAYNDATSVNNALDAIDDAFAEKRPLHLAGHDTPNQALFESILDKCISLGIPIVTISEYYDIINNYRDKYFNVFERNYEALVHLDNGTKIGPEKGLIVFDDTLANITAEVADRYISEGYKVAFWDDDSAEALAYAVPNNTKVYNAVDVTVDPSTNNLGLTAHTLAVNDKVVFSGVIAPEPLVFGTLYYIQAITPNAFKVKATTGGTVIDITTEGSGVKVSTYGYRDMLIEIDPALPINTFNKIVKRRYAVDAGLTVAMPLSHNNSSGALNDCNIGYFKRLGFLNGNLSYSDYCSFDLSYNKLTGEIPESIINCYHCRSINLNENRVTGGAQHIAKLLKTSSISLNNNPITGNLPRDYGNLIHLTLLSITGCQFSGVIPSTLGNLSLIQRFRFANNLFSSYETGAISVAMTDLIEVDFSGNAISNAAHINQIIADVLACVTISGKTGTLLLTGGTNAAPTGQGLIDKTALQGLGWTVNTK